MDAWGEEVKEYQEDRVRLINDFQGMMKRQYDGLQERHKMRELEWEEERLELLERLKHLPTETIVILDSDDENDDCDVPVSKLGNERDAFIAEISRLKEEVESLQLKLQEVSIEHGGEMLAALTEVTIPILFSDIYLLGAIL